MAKRRSAETWAEGVFGGADLGDPRRTQRLVKLGGDLAGAIGASLARAAGEDEAAAEAAYRFVRNDLVEARAIAEAGFAATVLRAGTVDKMVADEDSTSLSYTHEVARELGVLGGPKNSEGSGFHVHTVLLLDAVTGFTIGILEQRYWQRDPKARGMRHQRRKREYKEKESFKWQETSEVLRARLGEALLARIISTCDREADIYEYLNFKVSRRERFVVRASWDRNVEIDSESEDDTEADKHLFAVVARGKKVGTTLVQVPQRGGRPAREATLTVWAQRIRLKRPKRLAAAAAPPRVAVNAVLAREESPPTGVEPLEWLLFTSEPIATADDVLEVLRIYRLRWKIEVFHKAWKSGVGVERQRLQSADNLERIAVILAFVAIRLLQLRERHEDDPDASCQDVLTETEWKVLWMAIEKSRPPKKVPTANWAYRAIARLGGWHDSKRTGRVGWDSYWLGWQKLQERIEGYEAAKVLAGARL